MSGVIENIEANIEDLRNEVAKLKRKVEALENGEVYAEVSTTLEERLWSPQKERDEIVGRAKADINGLQDSTGYLTGRRGYMESESETICDADFIINKEKRTVVCLLRSQMSKDVHAKGIAKCAPNDCFNVHIGKAIALRRALGLEVPSEYLNAPQPTEVRVGDIVRNEYTDTGGLGIGIFYTRTVDSVSEDKIRYTTGRFDKLHPMSRFEIIDDSRE